MAALSSPEMARRPGIGRVPTGVRGLDDVLDGGLPAERATLICGGAGCGKSLLGAEILVRGYQRFGEPGVLMTFEETEDEVVADAASLGLDLPALVEAGGIIIDHVLIERDRTFQTGDFDLDGLFVRLGLAIDTIGAKRVVLDTLEVLFSALDDTAVLRAELRRLFRWLKDRGVMAMITAERGEGRLTRFGMEEYVSDCVILLDHRVTDQLATRRMRVVKYRGSHHGTSEYPFVIDDRGFSVLPVTSFDLDHTASDEVVATGIDALDAMLGRGGVFRGSTAMVSGSAGTGKTIIGGHFACAACTRGERTLVLAFEESAAQITRNLATVGLDLQRWVDAGLLRIDAGRPSQLGLESHLLRLYRQIEDFAPDVVVLDPITDFQSQGNTLDVKAMLMRMVDLLKRQGVTALFTSIALDGGAEDPTMSSLIDCWIQLRNLEARGERNRALFIVKARGMSHSNQVREFVIDDGGVQILDVVEGPQGAVTGWERRTQGTAT